MTEQNAVNDEESIDSYKDIVEKYFINHPDFFQDDSSKAVFLEGVLVGFLLETQRMANPEKRTNEPFWNALHELRLSKRQLLEIFPKTINKLKQLGRSYSGLVAVVSDCLQSAGMAWSLSDVELSWYFSHGIASYANFRKQKKEDKKK